MIRGVLLDLDGTVIEPFFDWKLIKEEMGIGDMLVLDAINLASPAEQERLWSIMKRHEALALDEARLSRGTRELLEFLLDNDISHAIVTNNSRENTLAIMEKLGVSISVVVSRDDGHYKPSPEPLMAAAEKLDVDIHECIMVGDSDIDMESAASLGIRAIRITNNDPDVEAGEEEYMVPDMHAALELIRKVHGDNK